MNSVFADTSFFVALLVRRDSFHAAAVQLMAALSARIVTADWILVETANFMARSKTRHRVVGFVRDLQADRRLDIVPSTAAVIETLPTEACAGVEKWGTCGF
jgi:predicted nucleic acid-binding protein